MLTVIAIILGATALGIAFFAGYLLRSEREVGSGTASSQVEETQLFELRVAKALLTVIREQPAVQVALEDSPVSSAREAASLSDTGDAAFFPTGDDRLNALNAPDIAGVQALSQYARDDSGFGLSGASELIDRASYRRSMDRLFSSLGNEWLRPPGTELSVPLGLTEACWCSWALVKYDVLTRFALEDWEFEFERRHLDGVEYLCTGRELENPGIEEELLIVMHGLGFHASRIALSEARILNPDLVIRDPLPQGFSEDGSPALETVMEAQAILNILGFQAGEEDGILNPLATRALRLFQNMIGLSPTGELDGRTMAFLRNCVFSLGDQPVNLKLIRLPGSEGRGGA
jgi:hypothetical protein